MINPLELLRRYEEEKKKWEEAGCPLRSSERMEEIFSICSNCPLFEKGKGWLPGYDRCSVCQCNLHKSRHTMNKIAWATTTCPAESPLWTPDA